MATLRGGGGIKVLKMYYVVCDWSLNEIKSLFLCLFQNKSYSEKNIFSKDKMEDSVDYITNQYLQRSLLYSSPSAEKCKYTMCVSSVLTGCFI